ncbi:DNA polymerase III subunit gamma/tau [Paracraurococcus ruber]|uniref:DNA polymerase III subunit gamma/tau n=1 Tax=Paracraurococcus ruber TaxID=77675 RepID=A0ABS1D0H1_9PROT|nr:DNA polymerase III subunit gamma/tau [Paracraurococcus ruber]MBK1659597.1 DNA polymerase III subunit gamma/tau [Paracraurococcus ruber]TDG28457.1 DNA polymerase III subunit gamma/tau [Paracraurococcus ruber]
MLSGTPDSPDEGLPEPPPPEGPGLFGDAFGPAPAPAPPVAPTPPAASPPPAPLTTVLDAPATPYRVLARKYRPSSFAELIGQDALVRTLRNAFAQNRVAHAFMLTGVRGVGKTTTARIIARALNCIGPDGTGGPTPDPCGTCPECRAILADRHPDVQELDAASNNGIDDVRELRERLRYRPAQGRFKVIILDEVHMLSTPAFNALLKTLEEPPAQVKFMLATTELRKVPATILSRCQTFHLKRVPQDRLRAHFDAIAGKESVTVEEEALAMLARAADGSVRDGLSLLDQAIALAGPEGGVTAEAVRDMLGLADRALVLDLMEALMAGDTPAALALMDRAHERGADPAVVLQDLLELTHTLTRLKSVPSLRNDPSLTEAERTRGAALAEKLSVPVLGRAWQMLLKGLSEVNEAPDRRAAGEMVLIRLAHVAELPTPGDLVKRLAEGGGGLPGGVPRPAPNGGGGGAPHATMPRGDPGGLRAMGGGGAMLADAVAAPAGAQPATWREIVAIASGRKPMLHAHLVHSVHPVKVAPGRLELRPLPAAPRDLAAQLAALLQEATGERWTIAFSNAEGEPTLAEQGRAAEAGRRAVAQSHPLVQAVLAAFPGASIEAVRDAGADAYGLGGGMALPAAAEDAPESEPGDIPPAELEEPAGFDDVPPPDDEG